MTHSERTKQKPKDENKKFNSRSYICSYIKMKTGTGDNTRIFDPHRYIVCVDESTEKYKQYYSWQTMSFGEQMEKQKINEK